MCTRSRSRSRNNSPQREASPAIVEPLRIELPFLEDQFQEDPPSESPMADNRTMAELLQAPTEGYEDAIVIPEITANNFELNHARIWLEKEPSRSIQTRDDLVSKFINQFFPPSKTTNLRNEITRFQQRFDESFYEAWERFNDLLRACLHHEFSKLHQLDTFYNALNVNDQDSLNSAAGGNFLDKMPRECLKIIESKSKVRQSQAKAVVAKVGTSSSTPAISSDVAELKDIVKALLLDKKNQSSAPSPTSTPAPVKAFEPNCVTCGGAHAYQNCPTTHENTYRYNIQEYVSQAAATNYNQGNTSFRPQMVANKIRPPGTLPGNTITNPKEDLKGISTRSGVAYQGPKTPSPSKQGTRITKDQVQTSSPQNTTPIQPSVIQSESQASVSEPVVAPVSALMPNLKPSIPYPSRRDNEKCHDQANEQIEKFYEIFKEMIILNKLPRKLGVPEKFIIPCEFSGMDECLALADLVSKPVGIAKDVSFKVRVFHFPTDFVVVDFEPDPRVPLILGRCFLNTSQALIDVHKGELTLPCEEYSQKVLGFSNVTTSGTPIPQNDPIISATSLTFTPFGDSDFLLFKEANAFLSLEDDPDSLKINPFYYDPEWDILLLEAILNSEPSPPLPN
nr:hypothetical protein [Tanacetum cinerariifolium]